MIVPPNRSRGVQMKPKRVMIGVMMVVLLGFAGWVARPQARMIQRNRRTCFA